MAAPKLEGKHFSLVFSYYSGSLYVFQCVVMQSSPIWLQIGRGMVELEGGELRVSLGNFRVPCSSDEITPPHEVSLV